MIRHPPNTPQFKSLIFKGIVPTAPLREGVTVSPFYVVKFECLWEMGLSFARDNACGYLIVEYDAQETLWKQYRREGKYILFARFKMGKQTTWQDQD